MSAATPVLSSLAAALLMLATVSEAPAVTRGNMPAYCRGEVAGQYGTRPGYVKTGKPKRTREGTSIDGTVDRGSEGIKTFRCRFDGKGNFVDARPLTSDGK